MKLALALLLWAGPEYPKQKGLVNDFAGIFTAEETAAMDQDLRGLKEAKNFVLVLVTVPSLEGQSVEQYTVGLANTWKIGEKGKNNGVVFLVAPAEHKARIENGYGAEETLTDIESKFILEEKVIPLFKEKKMAEGILSGTLALIEKLGGTAPVPARAPPPPTYFGLSMGAIIIIGVIILVVVVILLSTEAGRDFIVLALEASTSSSSSSGSSSSSSSDDDSSSSSGGGSFGGGGASSSW